MVRFVFILSKPLSSMLALLSYRSKWKIWNAILLSGTLVLLFGGVEVLLVLTLRVGPELIKLLASTIDMRPRVQTIGGLNGQC